MFARVTTGQWAPEKLDAGVRLLQERIDAAQQGGQLKGFKGLYSLIDRATGKVITVSLWETREDLEAVAALAEQAREAIAAAIGVSSAATVEIYEVALQA